MIEQKENLKFDLILCGKQAIDGDTAQGGPQVAECLDLPQVTYALDIFEKDGKIQVKREGENGYDLIDVQLPALVTVVKLPYEPRFPTMKSKLDAKKKEIKILSEEDLSALDFSRCGLKGSPTKVKKTYTASNKKDGIRLDGLDPDKAAGKLVDLLYEAKVV